MTDEQVVYLVGHRELERGNPIYDGLNIDRSRAYCDYHKIGVASDAEQRLSTLGSGTPHKLELITTIESDDARRVEDLLHRINRRQRHNGEWFYLLPNMINSLRALDYVDSDNLETIANLRFHDRVPDQSLYVQIMRRREVESYE